MRNTGTFLLTLSLVAITFGIGFSVGEQQGAEQVQDIKREILKCDPAPGFVVIEDTTYLIRYYPVDYSSVPKNRY